MFKILLILCFFVISVLILQQQQYHLLFYTELRYMNNKNFFRVLEWKKEVAKHWYLAQYSPNILVGVLIFSAVTSDYSAVFYLASMLSLRLEWSDNRLQISTSSWNKTTPSLAAFAATALLCIIVYVHWTLNLMPLNLIRSREIFS